MSTLPQLSSQRWTAVFLSIIILVTGTIFLFNYAIDPFGTRNWIVDQKYKPIIHERSEKYNYIFNQNNINRFDCLILGSSRAMKLTPSHHKKTEECYNFAVSMASSREKLYILSYWIKYKQLSTVYLGVDFLNLHQNVDHPEQPVETKFTSGNEGNYLSFYSAKIGMKSLLNSIHKTPETYFESDGSINYYNDDKKIKNHTFDFSPERYQQLANFVHHEQFVKKPFIYSNQSLEYLKQIKILCKQNKITLYVFIPPEQTAATKKIMQDPHVKPYYFQYKRDLVSLFGSIYDFSGNYPENQNLENFYDTWHYRDILADKMVHKFHDNENYGTVLNRENLEYNLIYFQKKFNEGV